LLLGLVPPGVVMLRAAASARWGGARASRRPAPGAHGQFCGADRLERHHALARNEPTSLVRRRRPGDGARAQHSPFPGGVPRRSASALVPVRAYPPGADRQEQLGVCRVKSGGSTQVVAISRAPKLHRRQPASTTTSASAELMWLRDQVERSHLILDAYGVPRSAVGGGTHGKTVTLTLAGRLRVLLGDVPRTARHAAPQPPAAVESSPH
jgi:hypothetical protein